MRRPRRRRQPEEQQDAAPPEPLEDGAGDGDAEGAAPEYDDPGFLAEAESSADDISLSSSGADSDSDETPRGDGADEDDGAEARASTDDDVDNASDSSGPTGDTNDVRPPPPVEDDAAAAELPEPCGIEADTDAPLALAAPARPPSADALPCWVKCDIPGRGSIVWYKSNGNFVASCSLPHHGGISLCKKTRTCYPSDRRRPQGRPLGHVLAWLLEQHGLGCVDQKSHHAVRPSLQQRREAREALKGIAGSDLLFQAERQCRDDEGSEPEGLA